MARPRKQFQTAGLELWSNQRLLVRRGSPGQWTEMRFQVLLWLCSFRDRRGRMMRRRAFHRRRRYHYCYRKISIHLSLQNLASFRPLPLYLFSRRPTIHPLFVHRFARLCFLSCYRSIEVVLPWNIHLPCSACYFAAALMFAFWTAFGKFSPRSSANRCGVEGYEPILEPFSHFQLE